MTLTRLLTAASFAAVMAAGAAHAQTTDTDVHVDAAGNVITHSTTTNTPVPNPDGSVSVTTDTTVTTTDAASAGVPASSLTTNYMGAPGTVTTRTVTNGPVPDTAENRAKYGQPMSRAGKRTAPAGN